MAKFIVSPRSNHDPKIYAYSDSHPDFKGMLKIGYTTRDAETRIAEQYPVDRPSKTWNIELNESAMRSDGTTFTDKDVHNYLKNRGFEQTATEWFRCSVKDVKAAILAVARREVNLENRSENYTLRPEQQRAIEVTSSYYRRCQMDDPDKPARFLWNAKMRFGKTFTSYELAREMGFKRILVLTFKPAVQNSWEDDLKNHVDFEGWQFISRNGMSYEEADKSKPIVCFGSFQDHLGKNEAGGYKVKNQWVHDETWDLVILDEYHYGSWRENAKELFESEDSKKAREDELGEGVEDYDESLMPIRTKFYLYLSGTPFRAINSGEFIEEQVFNWTYSDEQAAKESFIGENNPYLMMPKMILMTYQLPADVVSIASGGEYDEFDLNEFFFAEKKDDRYHFKHESEVQRWLDIIRGADLGRSIDDLKLGAEKPPMPFYSSSFLEVLTHTFWYLPSVASCYAMAELLHRRNNVFYHDYKIIVAAGSSAGIGVEALVPVREAMRNPLESKSITLSCGKLTTGVTVKPWTGIFMLRNLSSPESYFQAAFRVQSPWFLKNPDGKSPNGIEILKKECYVFDFAPNRALKQIADYSCRLCVNEDNPEKKVSEFIKFLPVLAYDGGTLRQINAAGVLEYAMSGTTATLLARRWESALLVNVDNDTLSRLFKNEHAMNALMSIEGFRSLSKDIRTVISTGEHIKKLKTRDKPLTPSQRKKLSEEELEYRRKRKAVQDKLIKFATRIPIFMYLTDFRECSLKDVITRLEPELFKKVTGITVSDFELLISLNVFNSDLMNDAVYKFKRYEDSSLSYAGINLHEGQNVGLYDTVITWEEAH